MAQPHVLVVGAGLSGSTVVRSSTMRRGSIALPTQPGIRRRCLPPSRPAVGSPLDKVRILNMRRAVLRGDHRTDASINGALLSGRMAAEAVLNDLS